MIAPAEGQHLVDLAGGTGDIASRFLKAGSRATIVDINVEMMLVGRQRPQLAHQDGLSWVAGDAEHIPLADGTADVITIAFGLRNVTDRPAALATPAEFSNPEGGSIVLSSHMSGRGRCGCSMISGLRHFPLWCSDCPRPRQL